MEDFITSLWAQILAGVALLVWLVRGEANTAANSKEIQRLWVQRQEDKHAADTQRHEDQSAQLKAREDTTKVLEEVRLDVKKLLSRHNGA